MANNFIKFVRGTQDEYNALKPTTDTSGDPKRDADTVYICTDEQRLFIGDKEYSRPVTIGSDMPGSGTAANYPLNSLYYDGEHGDLYYTDGTYWVNIYSLADLSSRFVGAQVDRTANTVLAAPNGSNGPASFRQLVAADIPNLAWSKITSGNEDLQAIEALTGTSGFLKKTATNTWALESSLLYIASYGSSTWQEVLNAYNENRVIYCRAGTGTSPGASSKPRMAFLAYVNNPTNPTSFEFQYYRSLNPQNRSETVQGDEVYTYTLTSSNSWSCATRKAYVEINAATNGGLTSSYSDTNGNYKLSLSLDTAYGDTVNPYGSKTQKYVLAAPTNADGIPEFRALTTSDISGYSSGVTSVSWDSTNGLQQSVDGGPASTIVSPSNLISDLGLSTAMHFRGIATVAITEGSRTNPTISTYSFGTNGANALAGDVIIDSTSQYEYVWTANGTSGTWEKLGSSETYSLSTHTHGNITNDGKIGNSSDWTLASGDGLVVFDSSNSNKLEKSAITFDASTTTQALTKAGSWQSFSYVNLNGSNNTTPSFYAPTGAGTSGQYLKSGGSGTAPTWETFSAATVGLGNVTNDAQVTNVAWDSTNKKITKTIGANTTDVATQANLQSAIFVVSSTAPSDHSVIWLKPVE